MNKVKTTSFTSIPEILSANAKDAYDLQKHFKEYEEVLREYVQRFTHQQSSSLSREDYEKVCKALDYLIIHTDYHADMPLKWNLYQGTLQIDQDRKKIESIVKDCQQMKFLFRFKEISDLFHIDLAQILKSWHEDNAWLYYGYTICDITVPLVDGLPVFLDMYGAKGTDFVLYYLERFLKEMKFCQLFEFEIDKFCRSYKSLRNIELESLNLNLFTLFFQQAFSHFIVSHTKSILLTQKDIHDLKQKLPSIDLTQAFFCFIKDFDTDLQTYFSLFQDDLLENYRQNLSHLIIENEFEEDVWNIKEYGANIDMDTIMEQFQWLPVEEIPASIQEMDMGIYDVFDLMDSLYLTKEEYQKLFHAFGKEDCMVMERMLIKAYGIMDIQDMDIEKPWIESLLTFIKASH
ncbi:DUF6179 domain-containing protein [Faecalicoccus pleomorphus]|uniref:DUF6179 domain-containing protein n=1 Tax=Faecalicoccus pleomorphus TaxID=1323 RepID=UPI0025A3A065|nr:DUF6179 domain-containing protein [Faecalicoccus pleomorphus]MDM8292617.1 DUF6179 domain-containing protein [Faecalicoccus pleomorphus]